MEVGVFLGAAVRGTVVDETRCGQSAEGAGLAVFAASGFVLRLVEEELVVVELVVLQGIQRVGTTRMELDVAALNTALYPMQPQSPFCSQLWQLNSTVMFSLTSL